MANLLQKLDFPDRAFLLPLLMLTLYLDHIRVKLEQNRMVGTIQNFVFFHKKLSTIFNKVSMPFRKTFL